nr:MAG TPA: E2 glycoprotein [Caudoviricetes sp.]
MVLRVHSCWKYCVDKYEILARSFNRVIEQINSAFNCSRLCIVNAIPSWCCCDIELLHTNEVS